MKWEKGDRSKIIDRREAPVPVSDPDALLRGMPQTPEEMAQYQRVMAHRRAWRAGQVSTPYPPRPSPGPFTPEGQTSDVPSQGDPAGLEARRAAILARMQSDQHALKELELRLNAMQKLKAPKP